jgi:pilus assembly protein CpaE
MYPLEVILIVRDEGVLQQLRRELARSDAVVQAEFADATAAMAELEIPEGQRRLFLMHIRDREDLRMLQALVQAFPTHPVGALVDEASELSAAHEWGPRAGDSSATTVRASLFVRAMRAGALQVATLPLDPEDFRGALESIAARFALPVDSTVIAVAGVQGGCGATTVALNLAHTLAETTGRKCILAELATHLGSIALHLDLKPEFTLPDLLRAPHLDAQAIRAALAPAGGNLSVLCGPYREVVREAATATGNQTAEILTLIEHLRRLAPIVVLDVPSNCDDQYFEILQKADKVLFVCEQTLPSVHSLHVIERAMLPAERQTRDVVVNRYDPHVKILTTAELQRLLKTNGLWKVSQDPTMATAANEGRPVRCVAPRSKPAAEYAELAHALVKTSQAETQHGFWNWLTGSDSATVAAKGG